MPCKVFQRDLIGVKVPGRFPHLNGVRAGDHDGSITFTFADSSTDTRIDFQAIVSDTQDYPENHTYFVFTTSEDPPSRVATVLENAQSRFSGVSLDDFLTYIDELVQDALRQPDFEADDDEEVGYGVDETDFDDDDDDVDWDMENEPVFGISRTDEKHLLKTLRRDLRAVKNAGLKVGCLGKLTGAIIVSVSCRIGRLDISEEAMEAWNVRASEYLVLLIRYPGTYVHFQELLALGNAKYPAIQFHVGLCDSYKPTAEDAIRAFQGNLPLAEEVLTGTARLRPLFIEQPLDSLLNERFLRIMELRYHLGLSWTGAELYIQQNQGRKPEHGALPDDYFEPDTWIASAPALFQDDYIDQGQGADKLSLPLIAMQFTLRHFVKCTEFCLVCHCKIRDSLEAIKPYVCSNSLCLFQYMALGMGPSLEHEIQFQPSVVDLLISLTYARAVSGRLTDFPTGLGLKVPGVLNMNRLDEVEHHLTILKDRKSSQVPTCHSGNLVPATMACRLDERADLKPGDWVVIFQTGTDLKDGPWHCRVQAIDVGTCEVQLSSPTVKGQQLSASELLPGPSQVKFMAYERSFDDLDVNEKRAAIRLLLDTLPNVDKMKAFVADSDNKRLAAWRDVISPAALDVLRWVVASNRSFILEDDTTHSDHRVTGMESYKQFRLVQGAPDKEQRFRAAVAANAAITKTDYPTIFAWHGSPVWNWHSILREGLHFKEVINGRAYGDGVYLSNNFHTSIGYTLEGLDYSWPQSNLKIRMLVSLNELVNAPTQFKHTDPHYVVTQLDWIQPRYLFVKCQGAGPGDGTANAKPSAMYKQDPKYPAQGPNGTSICIPISALNSQRRNSLGVVSRTDTDLAISASPGRKKRKRDADKMPTPDTSKNSIVSEEDDVVSVATAFDDLQILLSEDEGEIEEPPTVKPSKNGVKSDFEPGTLRKESLPLLSPPQYATTPATKVLQQHLQATLKVQAREPLHDLGWYIDPDFITTVYQWIVELHSFDPKLPLAKDLKQANMKSVVLELRFPRASPCLPHLSA
ncbi:putative ubiquitin conjugating enzyme [Aspergillus novofumigatus IBT 16806]|uniref:Putative ubiquitin conjugating enzyme n=1 Tax=Aspergillus novofumigatus (strain IBT 16806) TaxID=1392255 RepID=A0A2I1C424_ASPN1|nr:putative ubiquitin conjugating enzyme [Aspergillus novofumigatus IBT 16806]PKX92390.1 putative ubiquitin conjugating enzyme [Aspergillus novofumigatus IBT 16806]